MADIPTNYIGQLKVQPLEAVFPGQVSGMTRADGEDSLPNSGTRTSQKTTIAATVAVTAIEIEFTLPLTGYTFTITGTLPGGTAQAQATAIKALLEADKTVSGLFEIDDTGAVATLDARVSAVDVNVSSPTANVTVTEITAADAGGRILFGAPVYLKIVNGAPTVSLTPSANDAATVRAELCGIAKRVRHLDTPINSDGLGAFQDDDIVVFVRFAHIGVDQTDVENAPTYGNNVWLGVDTRAGEILSADDGGGNLVEIDNGKLKWLRNSVIEVACPV